jgi:bifunctional DNA-binding transcriptional regulator/antitoxin component of YhaV-PrlF toxin-antitoxin module
MKISQIEIQDNSDGELFFEIPPELLEDLGWGEGDKVKFIPNENGSFTIKKAKYSTIELDFSDDELLRYMTYAHEKGMTFNELIEDSVKDFLIKSDFEK